MSMGNIRTISEDNWSRIADGIQFRDTPGHGFVVLNAVRMDEMREEYPMLLSEENLHGMHNQFEEDCEWSRVFCAFWRELNPIQVAAAVRTLSLYYPSQFRDWIKAIADAGDTFGLLEIAPEDTKVKPDGRDGQELSLGAYIASCIL